MPIKIPAGSPSGILIGISVNLLSF